MSATILLGAPRIMLLGGAIAVLAAAGALTLGLKMPKPATAQHHAVLALPAQSVDPAILHEALQKLQTDGALP